MLKLLTRLYSTKTIFALSSGQGKCGVAVIRISGPQSVEVLKSITGYSNLPTPRMANLRSIRHPITKETLDKGLALYFPGEHSVELHVHGGLAVVNSVLDALGSIDGMRLAEPGEFTRRAFDNGKLDLTEVEGLADLLQAETEAQRKQAFLQTQGSLSHLYNKWKSTLINCVAHIEAHIDFEETETLDNGLLESVGSDIDVLMGEIIRHLQDGRKGERLRNGAKTVILGEPNVGKSSLLNLLCQRPAAIVTPIEGTTRDILEVTLNIGGYPLVLADTAGLRSKTTDVVEKEGIQRALDTLKIADLVILVISAENYQFWKENNPGKNFRNYLVYYLEKLGVSSLLDMEGCLIVVNKTDLVNELVENKGVVGVSCKTEDGVSGLVKSLEAMLKQLCGNPSKEHPSMNQMRHRQQLNECLQNLQTYKKYAESNGDLVLMAEYLRKALRSLGKLVGTVTTEQLLDVIFRDFCIGK